MIDDSLSIIRNAQEKDSRIRVFHKENSGVLATRNWRIEISKGFIDGDDWS